MRRTLVPLFLLAVTAGIVSAQPAIEWTCSFDSVRYSRFYGLTQTPDGRWLAAGFNDSISGLTLDGFTSSVDDRGHIVTRLPSSSGAFMSLERTPYSFDGARGYAVLAGYSDWGQKWSGDSNRKNKDGAISLLREDGTVLKTVTYGGEAEDYILKVHPTASGGYVFTGFSYSSGGDLSNYHWSNIARMTSDLWVGVVDSTSKLIWSKDYGGAGDESGDDILPQPDGSFVVLGSTNSDDGDMSDGSGTRSWLAHLDANGAILEHHSDYNVSESVRFIAIKQASDGNIVAVGLRTDLDSAGQRHQSVLLSKIRPDLSTVWTGDSNQLNHRVVTAVTMAPNGDILLAGYAEVSDDSSVWIARVDSTAHLRWIGTYRVKAPIEGSVYQNPTIYAIACANDGGFAVTGDGLYEAGAVQKGGPFIARFPADPLQVRPTGANARPMVQVYPNPVTSLLHIQCEGALEVELTNILGERVCRWRNPGQEITLDVRDLPVGTYGVAVRTATGTSVLRVVH